MTKQYVMKTHSPQHAEDALETFDDPDDAVDELQQALEVAQSGTIITISVIE